MKPFGFLPRNDFRAIAREAYRFAAMRAVYNTAKVINGVEYLVSVDYDLDCVFFDWIAPETGEAKATSIPFAKSWLN
jgi:hypothetical protein